jgi:lactoylglutathione lyase
MRIDHVALWTRDLERLRAFYERYFGARAGARYENPAKQFTSYFLRFDSGARLELMQRPDISAEGAANPSLGLAHFAVAVGDEGAVDALAGRMRAAGHPVIDGPRRTGDGYYEAVVLDPDGNRVEITALGA